MSTGNDLGDWNVVLDQVALDIITEIGHGVAELLEYAAPNEAGRLFVKFEHLQSCQSEPSIEDWHAHTRF